MNPNRVADLSVLLEETPLAYYWLGFLMADGHFYKRGAIKLHLAETDIDHVKKYGEFINYTGRAKGAVINVMNPPIVEQICSKFKISNRKTTEPCDLSGIHNEDLLFALFMGFFDGDGSVYCIKHQTRGMSVKIHSNWLSVLVIFEKFLYTYFKKKRKFNTNLARINKAGYALLMLSDLSMLAAIKRKGTELKLPMMARKWDKIDENIILNEVEKSEARSLQIQNLLSLGKTKKEIASILGVTKAAIHQHFWRKRRKSHGKICV